MLFPFRKLRVEIKKRVGGEQTDKTERAREEREAVETGETYI